MQTLLYRLKDGSRDLKFGFEETCDGWKIYILSHIPYGLFQDKGLHVTHRIYDEYMRKHYICWSPLPKTFEDAKAVTALWSDFTMRYCREGITLNEQFQQLQRKG